MASTREVHMSSSVDLKDSSPIHSGDSHASQPQKQSWREIKEAVMMSRKFHMQFASKIPHDFRFFKIDPELYPDRKWMFPKDVESYSHRIFFLGILPNKRENELLYVDVPKEPKAAWIDKAVAWKPVVAMYQGSLQPSYSREEELLRERKRVGVHGVISYEISQDRSRIFFPAGGDMYYYDAKELGRMNPNTPKYLQFKHDGVKIDPKMAPNNIDVVAYIMNNDIWVKHIVTGDEKRLTFANKGDKDNIKEPISAGVTSYVVQEEFDRYTGYWWQPGTPKGVHRILYEEVDESQVQVLHIFNPLTEPDIDSYRYPRSGTKNASTQLKILEFTVTEEGMISDSVIKMLPESLESLFPWMEYIVRVEWLSSGDGMLVQILDRMQQRTAIVYVPLSLFTTVVTEPTVPLAERVKSGEPDVEMKDLATPTSDQDPSITKAQSALNGIRILLEERNDIWFNVHDTYYFYKHQSGSNIVNFIWSSEKTGNRHLYHLTCKLDETIENDSIQCKFTEKTLTAGEWDVMEHNDAKTIVQIWVKEETNEVFFVGLKDTPLESHLYLANPEEPSNPIRLTQLGRSHTVSMDEDCTMFVTVSSSTNELYSAQLYQLTSPQKRPAMTMNILEAVPLIAEYKPPELFTYKSTTGFDMHGMIHKPLEIQPGKKYPTVLYVYGGPRVQLVTNSFKGLRYGRLFTLAALGYAVVTIDGRGSAHRGLAFEGAVKNKLGQIEIEDQVEGLQKAAEIFDCIDLKRVAIHGWSYGGYLSLMGLAQRPDVFKMAIAGAPVTSWELYDTAYTERYLGTPKSNPEGYSKGSVVKSATKFPSEPNRIFLFQGVIDENVHFVHTAHLVNALVRYTRPYHLQIYPGERHGIRSPESNEHYEVVVISYLQQYL
ncbi:dipeptidyl peptidase 9-like [Styela clava]